MSGKNKDVLASLNDSPISWELVKVMSADKVKFIIFSSSHCVLVAAATFMWGGNSLVLWFRLTTLCKRILQLESGGGSGVMVEILLRYTLLLFLLLNRAVIVY